MFKTTIAALALMVTSVVAQASVITAPIDEFTNFGEVKQTYSGGATESTLSSTVYDVNIMGDYRDLFITDITPGTGGAIDVSLKAGLGQLSYATGSGTTADGHIVWDGVNDSYTNGVAVNGLNNYDLTGAGLYEGITAFIIDADTTFNVDINTWWNDGNESHSNTFSFETVAIGEQAFLSFDDGRFGETDWSRLGALEFVMYGEGNMDFQLGSLEATSVPEPGMVGLFALAGAGMVLARRRKVTSA